jgi:hypothetical protein
MDNKEVIDYLKLHYPKIVINPINFKEHLDADKAFAFILSKHKLIIGYITKNGRLHKLIDPIDIKRGKVEIIDTLIKKIPIVDGLSESDKIKLLDILEEPFTKKINDNSLIIKDLKDKLKKQSGQLKEKNKQIDNYKILVGNKSEDCLLINKEHENVILQIKDQLIKMQEANDLCKDRILYEKELIIDSIKNFRSKMQETARIAVNEVIQSKNQEIEDVKRAFGNLNKMYKKLLEDKKIIENNLSDLKKREDAHLEKLKDKEDLITDFSYQLNNKEDEITKLNSNIEMIENELKDMTESYTKEKLEKMVLSDFKKNCFKHILEEKEQIINKIKDYNNKWFEWSDYALNNIDSINEYTDKLVEESKVIFENLENVLQDKKKYIKDLEINQKEKDQLIKNLNNNIEEIKLLTEKVINDQIIQLSVKTEDLKARDEIIKNKELEMNQQYLEYQDNIDFLQNELDKVNKLLDTQRSQKLEFKKIDSPDDIKNCHAVLQRFISVNNMFYRKKEIMRILDSIILDNEKLSLFHNLSDSIKDSIKKEYLKVKDDINKHILFLDLEKYINSPNIEYFKSKTTYDKIPGDFCEDLFDISEYWLNNINLYKIQDRILTNIYEDLSGAVRVYIKVKPLQPPTDVIKVNENMKSIVLECGGKKETFGDYYGVFDGSYSNMDIYTGNYQTESVENIGLYNSFRQVEDGYSIILFGYGISGSGKTTLLLGESNAKIPGILHHGISNLRGVKNIKVRNIFEQYIKEFIPTINKMKGRIHNLVKSISQLKEYSIDETDSFSNNLPVTINLNNIKVDDLYTITSILEKYRVEKKRIKKTPNNPVSSRSHLYIVLEILFDTGKTGYITVVDTAGKEKPTDIYNTFLETSRQGANLTTILGPTGGTGLIERYMRKEYRNFYEPRHIYNLLREGFYINETLNHLVYFFNKKNYRNPRVIMQSTLDKYSGNKYYVDPRKEETLIDPNNNSLTIPIMKFLDSLSKKKGETTWHPTKFITFMCLRQEADFCNETFDTMEFANKIKST